VHFIKKNVNFPIFLDLIEMQEEKKIGYPPEHTRCRPGQNKTSPLVIAMEIPSHWKVPTFQELVGSITQSVDVEINTWE
jgi:hypothetical protein